jgi:hypothetical protein
MVVVDVHWRQVRDDVMPIHHSDAVWYLQKRKVQHFDLTSPQVYWMGYCKRVTVMPTASDLMSRIDAPQLQQFPLCNV